jgi:hypothetical protein
VVGGRKWRYKLLKTILLKLIGIFLILLVIGASIATLGTVVFLWTNAIALGTSGNVTFFSVIMVIGKTVGYAVITTSVTILSYLGLARVVEEIDKDAKN